MKKTLIIIAVIIVILCMVKSEKIIIPKEAIRFRVIANSNEEKDQFIKKQIVKNLKQDLQDIKFVPKDINESRQKIKNHIPSFKDSIEKTLKELKETTNYKVEYGTNYFPQKEYQGIVYEAGEYESLVITIGDGFGENFWCVLFPPLCLLEGDENETGNIEYTTFIKELLNKYL